MEKLGFARHLLLTLIAAFAGAALVLAAMGLYGIIAFSVNSRTRELGIRTALGASEPSIFLLVISSALRLTAGGIVLGLLGAAFLTRFISARLFGTKPTDPVTLATVTLLLVAVAILACLAPARRAAKVDPMEALRTD